MDELTEDKTVWTTFGSFLVAVTNNYVQGRCNSRSYNSDGVEQVVYRWAFVDGKFACGVYVEGRPMGFCGWTK